MKKASIATSFIFIAISIFVFVTALSFPPASNGVPGPGFFPMVLSGIVILLSVLLILNELRDHSEASKKSLKLFTKENSRVWIALGLTVLYTLLINAIGFVLVTPFYLFTIMKFFRVKSWKLNLTISVLTTAFLYIIFTLLLAVQLPSGFLF